MNYVIATKLRNSPNSNLGYIQPYIIEEGGKTRIVKDDDFPNRNTIFVKGGYEEFIESKFQGEDLFRIPFNDSDNYKEEENNSCAYMALATEVSDLRKVEYFHLIDSDFDIKNRFIYFPYKPRRYIFIRSLAKLLYGPFDYDEPEYNPSDNMYYVELKALQRLPKNGSVKDWSVYKLSEGDLEIKSILNQKILLANLDKVESLDPAVVDYISDEQLIKWGNDLLQILDRLPKKDLRNYQELIQVLPASDSDFISLRRERFLLLIDRTIFWSSQQSSLLSDYLQSDSGIEKINNYLETNYEIIQNAAKERFEKKYNEMEKPLKDEIEVLLQQKNSLEKEIDKTKENVSKKQQEDLTQEVLNIQDKLAISKRELEEVCDRLQIAKTAEKLRSERDYLERRKEELKEDLSSLQETKKLIVDDINTSQEALKKELRKLKPYVDLLNGIIPDEKIPENEGFSTIKIRENKPKDANELILEVTENLKQYGRDYQFEDVANFVLCTQQNFLTVFAGLPGVGKTSLVSSLAKSLNLESEQRFITIPTARGWTSQRDILGFYNSLTHKYQPSPTGLYRILKSCHFEYQKIAISQQSPCWILLDEANLSPIEHYWSSFLGMCDDNFTREIYTGDNF